MSQAPSSGEGDHTVLVLALHFRTKVGHGDLRRSECGASLMFISDLSRQGLGCFLAPTCYVN